MFSILGLYWNSFVWFTWLFKIIQKCCTGPYYRAELYTRGEKIITKINKITKIRKSIIDSLQISNRLNFCLLLLLNKWICWLLSCKYRVYTEQEKCHKNAQRSPLTCKSSDIGWLLCHLWQFLLWHVEPHPIMSSQ